MTPDNVEFGSGRGIALVGESQRARKIRKRLTRRSRIHTATIFIPMSPNETPEHHFPLQTVFTRTPQPRFVNRYDSREILLVVDGSCINNGSKDQASAGGCSFTYKGPGKAGPNTAFPFSFEGTCDGGQVGFPLEECGPGGESHDPTSNRAKLRAVIAALEFRAWQEEGWRRIVIATNLEYVVLGATTWLPVWVSRRWRTRKSKKVVNRDLWEELNGIIENLFKLGTEVSFWLLPPGAVRQDSSLIRDTKEVARDAATLYHDAVAEEFTRLCGIEV
ncbi:hypothetical protein F5X99DRAFT_371045 [Biscogniauxia marginata]|nr:hypothetical protein F5X99DRAFT_371045 [Biscogniauxia marginata]